MGQIWIFYRNIIYLILTVCAFGSFLIMIVSSIIISNIIIIIIIIINIIIEGKMHIEL